MIVQLSNHFLISSQSHWGGIGFLGAEWYQTNCSKSALAMQFVLWAVKKTFT